VDRLSTELLVGRPRAIAGAGCRGVSLVLSDRNVKAILLNAFAGINRCDWVAEGVVKACRELNVDVPLVVRLSGTNVEAGRDIIAKSGRPIISADTLADATKAAVEAAHSAPQREALTA
jgi:malate-CoA ligase subunit beta